MMRSPIIIRGLRGLGDNIYQRAFIKTLAIDAPVFLDTPWPEIYEGIPNVQFVKPVTALRTQRANAARQPPERWVIPPRNTRELQVHYTIRDFQVGSMITGMERVVGRPPGTFDLPQFPRFVADKPIAVVRPVTERKEWWNSARSPKPEYVAHVAGELMDDYHVVSVADLLPNVEWLVGDEPPAHVKYHAGELHVRELLGLIQSAHVVLGGVGWIVPAAIASRVPLFCILGGQGGHNGPSKVCDKRMDLSRVYFAMPDNLCACESMRHSCNKTNSRLMEQWTEFRSTIL